MTDDTLRDGTTFYACRKCYERGCKPTPEDSTTEFERTWTETSSSTGYSTITIDSDGDASEDEPDGWDSSGESYTENEEYIRCRCCAHEIKLDTWSDTYRDVSSHNDIVALWQDDNTSDVYTLAYAVREGWAEGDLDDYPADDNHPNTDEPTPLPKSDGRYINASVTDLAAAIGSITEDVGPDTAEVTLTFQQ